MGLESSLLSFSLLLLQSRCLEYGVSKIVSEIVEINFFKVFQRLKSLKNDRDVAIAPKTDQNHYYGIYYRFDLNLICSSPFLDLMGAKLTTL